MLKSIKICFALVLIHICSPGFSQGLSNVVVHGFVSQGCLKSTENNFLANSKDGSFEFNEAAINFMTQINPKLRIGLQLFSRDLGRESNNSVILDWAYGDYHWQDYLGIRFGKIKMPLGYYNIVRDVDIYRNSILLPQGVYDETQRDFSLAMQGGLLYGYIPIIGESSFEYELYLGTLTIPDAHTTYWNWALSEFAQIVSEDPVYSSIIGDTYIFGDRDVIGKTIRGAFLNWNTPIDGFRMGGAMLRGELMLHTDMKTVSTIMNSTKLIPLDIKIAAKIDKYNLYSTEYTVGNFTFSGEYLEQRFETTTSIDASQLSEFIKDNTGLDLNGSVIKSIAYHGVGYYGQVNYKPSEWWSVNAYYSEFYPDKNDKDGRKMSSATDRPTYFGWQNDLCLTLRLDPVSNWIFKLEGHYIDGTAQAYRFDLPSKRYWNLFAIKASYYF